ncbi:hypothetical protein [Luteibacter sp. dw_328]|uniref:hypothetical protein n=1 Tax=Luteibacter sp. dw_328 TaxID=2719796 RepID=UPI001BD5042E|nr:hypothetical protein [Luteibacter sp. dw_328]
MPDYRAAQIPMPQAPSFQKSSTPGFGAGGLQALEDERRQRQQVQQPQAPAMDVQTEAAPALPQPDGALIKSVYCYSEISAELDRSMPSSRKAMADPKTSKMEKAVIQQMVQEGTARKERVAAYMRPRSEHVDNGPLSQAFNQGKADYNQSVIDALTCNRSCPATGPENQTCNDSCNAKSSAWHRAHTCDGLGFLPKAH